MMMFMLTKTHAEIVARLHAIINGLSKQFDEARRINAALDRTAAKYKQERDEARAELAPLKAARERANANLAAANAARRKNAIGARLGMVTSPPQRMELDA